MEEAVVGADWVVTVMEGTGAAGVGLREQHHPLLAVGAWGLTLHGLECFVFHLPWKCSMFHSVSVQAVLQ